MTLFDQFIFPFLSVGVCWVNAHNLFDAAASFGGYRESGFGRDGGKEVRLYTLERRSVIQHFHR